MTGSLVVHLNRGSLHEVSPETDAFETTGSFDVELRNHGQAVHVHLRLDDALGRVASVAEANHFVDTDDAEVVRIEVEEGPRAGGELTVVSGYGNTEESVEVVVGEPDDGPSVDVRESLGRPQPREDEGLQVEAPDGATLRVAGLAAVALALAAVAVVVATSVVVILGALVVLLAVAVAGYLLVS